MTDEDSDGILKWKIEPIDLELMPEEEGHSIVIAKQTLLDQIVDCYIDLITPERIVGNGTKIDSKDKVILKQQ